VASLLRTFELPRGENFFEFAYDWRRDNRPSAHPLAAKCDDWLGSWRRRSGSADARLILIAHVMGGLVSRYFLEPLEGWRVSRMLITIGTNFEVH
jgi:predicted alpha/beta hydrolase family esterase